LLLAADQAANICGAPGASDANDTPRHCVSVVVSTTVVLVLLTTVPEGAASSTSGLPRTRRTPPPDCSQTSLPSTDATPRRLPAPESV
jgi:hypothetical protein